ncbi:GSCFA domain-containing protein [Krasilnikovia sp. MM14-A1259]|uniref:GSCFA domain-containing protein n=1 Tax=Krasilnikovia sp. MM14-A1259 TaxID=3373539 RepID=UPI0038167F17
MILETVDPWFSRVTGPAGPTRLFCFPHAGGNPADFLAWAGPLGPDVELLLPTLPGRGSRLFEPPIGEFGPLVEQLTGAVSRLADRPFALFGHSFGALVAFEIARALRRAGGPVPVALWVSGAEGPQLRSQRRRVHDLPDDELIDVLREYAGTSAELLEDRELVELILPAVRADFAMNEHYTYRPEPPLALPIHVLHASDDPHVVTDPVAGWTRETTYPPHVTEFSGGHFFLREHEAAVAGLLRAGLTAADPRNPYQDQPARAFWRTGVAEPDPLDITDVWRPKFAIGQDDPIITAGSCFAREIGRALLERGMHWYVAELPPPGLSAAERADRHYGEFSFRTGNIYTTALLRQWVEWAFGKAEPPASSWEHDGRHFDPYRPSVDPAGFASLDDLLAARQTTLAAIRRAVETAVCFVFTMGQTEAWADRADGTVFPSCPGTIRGTFDPDRHVLRNLTFSEVYEDLAATIQLCQAVNPGLRVLLTVSPHPITATASDSHALVASTHAKSVLRAVAGELAAQRDDVDYFPSYELITGAPFRARFYQANLRTVSPEGVAFVMRHFLGRTSAHSTVNGGDPSCDDAVLDYYNAH